MRYKIILATLAAIALAGPVSASTLVVGQSLGAACFQEAKTGQSGRAAIAVCNRALSDGMLRHSDIAATYVNRGIVRSSGGDLTGAITDYNRAIKINPKLGEAFANRATVYIRQSLFNQALGELDHALSLELAQPALVYFNRAIVHEHFGDLQQAYRDYSKAVELRPKWQQPQLELIRFSVHSK